jgi:hypothetical protein
MILYVAAIVGYDTHIILGIYDNTTYATEACVKYIDSQIRYCESVIRERMKEESSPEEWVFWEDEKKYFQSIRDVNFMEYYKRDGSTDSPIIEEYVLNQDTKWVEAGG